MQSKNRGVQHCLHNFLGYVESTSHHGFGLTYSVRPRLSYAMLTSVRIRVPVANQALDHVPAQVLYSAIFLRLLSAGLCANHLIFFGNHGAVLHEARFVPHACCETAHRARQTVTVWIRPRDEVLYLFFR